jgi:hypothetical protein
MKYTGARRNDFTARCAQAHLFEPLIGPASFPYMDILSPYNLLADPQDPGFRFQMTLCEYTTFSTFNTTIQQLYSLLKMGHPLQSLYFQMTLCECCGTRSVLRHLHCSRGCGGVRACCCCRQISCMCFTVPSSHISENDAKLAQKLSQL